VADRRDGAGSGKREAGSGRQEGCRKESTRQDRGEEGAGQEGTSEGGDEESASEESSAEEEEGEITNADSPSHHRSSADHREELGGVSGPRRVHLRGAPRRNEAADSDGHRATV